jgi:glycosyltransferase involved in cell wall biosynthesis
MYPNSQKPDLGIFIHNQVKSLIKQGSEVVVVSPIPWVPEWLGSYRSKWNGYRNIPREAYYDDVKIFHPRYFRTPGGKWVYPWEGFSMYMGGKSLADSLHRKLKFDLIHAHRIIPDGYAAVLLGKKLNIPVMCSARGGETYLLPFVNRLCYLSFKKVLNTCDRIITVSEALRDVVANNGFKHTVDVIYNGCNVDTFHYIDKIMARKKLTLPLDRKIFLFVGHIITSKGILELIKAFHHLKKEQSSTFLIMIGYGDAVVKIEKEIKIRNLTESVLLPGYIPQNKLHLWINASDIFVLPSYQEGLPNVVLEAMACRKPVIATRVGGIPEVVFDGVTGILVEPRNLFQLAQAMETRLQNEDLCIKLGVEAERLIHENFTWEKSAKKLIEVYRNLLENRNGNRSCDWT